MKLRLPPPVAGQGAWLIAGRSAAGAVLLAVTVSACTGGGSSAPSIFPPSAPASGPSSSHPATRTPSPTGQASRSPAPATSSTGHGGASASGSSPPPPAHSASSPPPPAHSASSPPPPAHSASSPPPPAHSASSPPPPFPAAAPQTGGGGTAGLQDGLLFGAGAAAALAGLGTLAYRRRLARKLGGNDPARRGPADKEPTDG